MSYRLHRSYRKNWKVPAGRTLIYYSVFPRQCNLLKKTNISTVPGHRPSMPYINRGLFFVCHHSVCFISKKNNEASIGKTSNFWNILWNRFVKYFFFSTDFVRFCYAGGCCNGNGSSVRRRARYGDARVQEKGSPTDDCSSSPDCVPPSTHHSPPASNDDQAQENQVSQRLNESKILFFSFNVCVLLNYGTHFKTAIEIVPAT